MWYLGTVTDGGTIGWLSGGIRLMGMSGDSGLSLSRIGWGRNRPLLPCNKWLLVLGRRGARLASLLGVLGSDRINTVRSAGKGGCKRLTLGGARDTGSGGVQGFWK